MSTPIFVRTLLGPLVGSIVSGQDLTPAAFSDITWSDIMDVATEDTLVDEISYHVEKENTDAGHFMVALCDGSGHVFPIGDYPIPAGTSESCSAGRVKVQVPVAVGWKLQIAHDVKANGGGARQPVSIVAFGGIVR